MSAREPDGARRDTAALDRFVGAAPLPQRSGLRLLLALARRRRGATLLERVPAAAQVVQATLAMIRYDDPRISRALGWDPAAVVARGREQRERLA